MKVTWSASSTSGSKKPENDDSWVIFSANENASEEHSSDSSYLLNKNSLIFAISDGMGGRNAGHFASQFILENLSLHIPEMIRAVDKGTTSELSKLISDELTTIHNKINQLASDNEAYHRMGATLTLAWFTPEKLYIVQIGDSRLYLHRDSETTQLTEDHTFIWQKLQRGEVSERQYRNHHRRSVLYEVIGAAHRTIRPMITEIPYQPGDQFMLCSDGLIDGLWEKHIHSAFTADSNVSPHELRAALLNRAIENDGSDDTTLITLKIEES